MGRDQARVIELQRQVRIARAALEKIANNVGSLSKAGRVAEEALDAMQRSDKPAPLAGVLGWERRP